jgi:glucose-1-phosphate thymidylyltransferase
VRIEAEVELSGSQLGPNVSLGRGSRVIRSTLRDCIVGENVVIEDCRLSDSLIGSGVEVSGVEGTVMLGDHSVARSVRGA